MTPQAKKKKKQVKKSFSASRSYKKYTRLVDTKKMAVIFPAALTYIEFEGVSQDRTQAEYVLRIVVPRSIAAEKLKDARPASVEVPASLKQSLGRDILTEQKIEALARQYLWEGKNGET
jgi:hypothetical protein